MIDLEQFLRQEGVDEALLGEAAQFRTSHAAADTVQGRIPVPVYKYYGKDVWEKAIAAILCGENLLLAGPKATGKNVLAQNLALLFGRPLWDVSFHVNVDAAYLIGSDTYDGTRVTFRPGPVYQSAVYGGFAVLDEINMARNEALAVLHAALDFRRVIDVAGYDKIQVDPEDLGRLINDAFPDIREQIRGQFVKLFFEIERKAHSAEISERALDLRGLLDAIALMKKGVKSGDALEMCIVNKTFDEYERSLVMDVIRARIPEDLGRKEIFG